MTGLTVRQIAVGPMANFVYLVFDEETKEGAVIDSGWETGPIELAVKEAGAGVKYAIATHGHFDHTSTLRELARTLGAKVVAHENSQMECDLRLRGDEELEVGRTTLKVMHTPGHTEDSICIYDGREVFTGDTLFVGAIGRFRREDAREIYTSLHDVLLRLPPRTVLYPGHDYGEVRSRTLAEEKASNPFLQVGSLNGFISAFS